MAVGDFLPVAPSRAPAPIGLPDILRMMQQQSGATLVPGASPRVNIGAATYGTGPIPQPSGGQAIPLGAGQVAPTTAQINAERLAAMGVKPGGTGTLFADPSNIDLSQLRDPAPRYSTPRGNLNGGAYLSDGNGGLGAKAVQQVYGPNTPPGWTPPESVVKPNDIASAATRMPSEAIIGNQLGAAASGTQLPSWATKDLQFKGSGLASRLGPTLGALAAQGWVDQNVNPNTSVGPFDKGTVNATLGGAAVGGGIGGPVGGVVGGLGAGLGDMGAKVVNADTDNMNILGQLGTGLLRGGLAIPGAIAGIRDEQNNEAQGGVADLFKEGGALGAVGGLVGMGGEGPKNDQQAPQIKPQEMLDRAWDMTGMDPELRQSMQIVKDLRVQGGEKEEDVAKDMLNDILGEYTGRQNTDRQLAEVAAQQQQALRYIQPYTESIRANGQMQAEAMKGMLGMLPPEMQGYGNMAITGAGTRANTLADSLMAQAAMGPTQAIQQARERDAQAYQDQLNQQIMAIQIQNDLYNMQQNGQAPVPIESGGGI